MKILVIYLIIINIIGFLSMYRDKKKAINDEFRTPEKDLLFIALIGGSLGSLMGMYICRHKTKHAKFIYGVPFILLINLVIIYIIIKTFM